jgi:hypothetical protein
MICDYGKIGRMIIGKEQNYSENNQLRCHFDDSKSHMGDPGLEHWPL